MELTLGPFTPLGEMQLGRRDYPSGCRITSHNGHCVTIEPRRRCNMSYESGCCSRWHARCLYHTIGADSRPGRKQASEYQESTGGISAGWRTPVPCPRLRRTTLLHTSKRPIDQPRESGVFFWGFPLAKRITASDPAGRGAALARSIICFRTGRTAACSLAFKREGGVLMAASRRRRLKPRSQ